MSFGLTPDGFNRKPFSQIQEEVEDTLRITFGESINLIAPSVLKTFTTIYSEREALIWELSESIYNAQFPNSAIGASLDSVVAINGLTRQSALRSTASVNLFGDIGTLIPIGTQLSVQGNPEAIFETLDPSTLIAGLNAEQEITFSAAPDDGSFKISFQQEETSDLGFGATAGDVQTALNALDRLSGVTVTGNFGTGFVVVFDGEDGLQPQPLFLIVENSLEESATPVVVTVAETVEGISQGTVNVRALEFGTITAPATLLSIIDTPVSGLNRVENPLDAVVGRNEETDLELRQRQRESFQVGGAATIDAIFSRVRNVDSVTQVLVLENDTNLVDMDGRPPHSFETLVQGGLNQEIADEIFRAKAAGIRTFGNQTETHIDTQGISHDVRFSRPVDVDIYMEVEINTTGDFPSNGVDLIKQALVNKGRDAFSIGDDVIVIPTLISALDLVPGITDADLFVGTAPNPTLSNNISIDTTEVATFDVSRVEVTIL